MPNWLMIDQVDKGFVGHRAHGQINVNTTESTFYRRTDVISLFIYYIPLVMIIVYMLMSLSLLQLEEL